MSKRLGLAKNAKLYWELRKSGTNELLVPLWHLWLVFGANSSLLVMTNYQRARMELLGHLSCP